MKVEREKKGTRVNVWVNQGADQQEEDGWTKHEPESPEGQGRPVRSPSQYPARSAQAVCVGPWKRGSVLPAQGPLRSSETALCLLSSALENQLL